MRTLAITQNITVDGAVEMLDPWFDPTAQAGDRAAHNAALSARCDAILLGRQTFEDFRGYWPKQTDDRTGITDELNRTQKYVVSSTLGDPEWQNSTVLDHGWRDQVRDLKAADGGDIVVAGSIRLCHALLTDGLVDEVRLYVFPAVQGRGRRLFPDGYAVKELRPKECTAFDDGVRYLSYAVQ
ncbi:dihydrofolate reductase family protein [Pseudonocardia sp. CA-107938]|uniref:dihydrofolate reductase family protein n=1 Tax=Pseudonocardia sp. CA-107938 TaxID=3240021 RepID=UPI003D8BD639